LKALADAAEDWARLRQERDRLKGQLLEAENTIATLRSKGKQVVADRNRWEALARGRANELAGLQEPAGPSEKFRQVKALLGKKLHSDCARTAGEAEKMARAHLQGNLAGDREDRSRRAIMRLSALRAARSDLGC
jgi:hypothetical protein